MYCMKKLLIYSSIHCVVTFCLFTYRKAAAFMDIVDTFNHLIPSDQLDDALTIGQNLECEASNEFGPGIQLEDSLKNMLSDKDPMFGCSTSQFNLLDNEDSTFQISGSGGMSADRSVHKNKSVVVKPKPC